MAERETTFDVRVWKVSKVPSAKKSGKPGHAYRVRWSVAGRTRSATFPTAALAESERAALMTAARRGEAFDVASGRPVSLVAPEPEVTYSWWEWALVYVDLKWPGLAPNSRLSLAEALTAITMALLPQTPDRPPAAELRKAMMQWAFIVPRRTAGGPPADLDRAVTWLAANAPELSALSDPVVIRSVLDALALKLDRTPAAATTVARKRAVLFNALELAVEQGRLHTNPMPRVRWKAPKPAAAIDPACVVNIDQARALLAAVAEVGPLVRPPPRPYPEDVRLPPPRVLRGGPLVAFFGCLYYAGLRPSEALALVEEDLQLPDRDDEWGLIRVSRNDPEVTTAWTDRGRREPRQLKHRAKGEVRVVPCSPELAALLSRHLREYGVDRYYSCGS